MERYDTIGHGYSERRIADRRIADRIRTALGSATSVANIGAGTGSYEPESLLVIPIEPSPTMIAQRPAHLAPAIRAPAEALPLADDSVDAAMAVLTVHHWIDVVRGIREMQRVARDTIAIVTIDTAVSEQMWLLRDYMPQTVRDRDRAEFPSIPMLTATLGESTTVRPIPVPSDCTDGFLLAFWSRPEAVLDPRARAATSGFARLDATEVHEIVERLSDDLDSGEWDRRYGHLRTLSEFDAGLRLVTATPTGQPGRAGFQSRLSGGGTPYDPPIAH